MSFERQLINRRIKTALSQCDELRRQISRDIECVRARFVSDPFGSATQFTFVVGDSMYGFGICHYEIDATRLSFSDLFERHLEKIEHSHFVRIADRCGLNQRLNDLRKRLRQS